MMTKRRVTNQADLDIAYELAMHHCSDSCKDYHATRPYLVAAGVKMGPERDSPLFEILLHQLLEQRSSVLIAGAADEGLLRFVTQTAGKPLAITVADRCITPLLVNKRYAVANGIDLDIIETDLTSGKVLGRYDLIIAHAIIPLLGADKRADFLRSLSAMLSNDGVIVTAFPLWKLPATILSEQWKRTLENLDRSGLKLPGDPAPLVAALRRFSEETHHPFDSSDSAMEALCEAAGLGIVKSLDSSPSDRFPDTPHKIKSSPRRYLVLSRLATHPVPVSVSPAGPPQA